MGFQPGLPGSQFPSEDVLIRRIQDLEKAVQQLAAANPFAPMGMTPIAGGVELDGSLTVDGPMNVAGTANFTGNTTIGGTASIAGDVTKTNSWGTSSLGPVAFGNAGAAAPGLTFTRAGTTFAQSVGLGLKADSSTPTTTVLEMVGPAASSSPGYVSLSSDGTFTLASDSSTYSQISSSPGPNGTVTIYGGGTNGSVNLNSYGTGNVQVNGAFRVTGTKAFIMDHPVYPDTMTLMHAATESPVNGVEYWGTATLDVTGQATATLPSYFEALTKATGRNIQLTPIGRTTVQVSADRIVDGSFTIYGAPGQEVDWLVKAERQHIVDGYDELSFPVEIDKVLIGPQLPQATR